jgi:hypothetical protein
MSNQLSKKHETTADANNVLAVVLPPKEDILKEAEKQISDWLEGSTEREKEHYRVAFRRSFEYIFRVTKK